jgi:hypothetical protein
MPSRCSFSAELDAATTRARAQVSNPRAPMMYKMHASPDAKLIQINSTPGCVVDGKNGRASLVLSVDATKNAAARVALSRKERHFLPCMTRNLRRRRVSGVDGGGPVALIVDPHQDSPRARARPNKARLQSPLLFTPLTVRGVTARNRIVVSPMSAACSRRQCREIAEAFKCSLLSPLQHPAHRSGSASGRYLRPPSTCSTAFMMGTLKFLSS